LVPEGIYIDIVIDPSSPETIWTADQFSGVYFSTDGGHRWKSHNLGLDVKAVTDLVISKDGRTLYAATHGGGVYRLSTLNQNEFSQMARSEPVQISEVIPTDDLMSNPSPEANQEQQSEKTFNEEFEQFAEPTHEQTMDEPGGGNFPCFSGIPLAGITVVFWLWKRRN
jgi:photosystem II stability/assembly factor-like uncharacterized protein